MRRSSPLLVVTLIGCFAAAGWVYAQQRSSSRAGTLTAQDRDEIQELYARYNQGTDFDDVATFMSIWTDDAVFKPSPKLEFTGRKAIEDWRTTANAARKKSNAPPRRHFNSSLIITPTPEGARGRNYFLLMDVGGKEPRIYASGIHDDTFVKTASGWRIKMRVDHNDPGE
jgi:hypothetical protein